MYAVTCFFFPSPPLHFLFSFRFLLTNAAVNAAFLFCLFLISHLYSSKKHGGLRTTSFSSSQANRGNCRVFQTGMPLLGAEQLGMWEARAAGCHQQSYLFSLLLPLPAAPCALCKLALHIPSLLPCVKIGVTLLYTPKAGRLPAARWLECLHTELSRAEGRGRCQERNAGLLGDSRGVTWGETQLFLLLLVTGMEARQRWRCKGE